MDSSRSSWGEGVFSWRGASKSERRDLTSDTQQSPDPHVILAVPSPALRPRKVSFPHPRRSRERSLPPALSNPHQRQQEIRIQGALVHLMGKEEKW